MAPEIGPPMDPWFEQDLTKRTSGLPTESFSPPAPVQLCDPLVRSESGALYGICYDQEHITLLYIPSAVAKNLPALTINAITDRNVCSRAKISLARCRWTKDVGRHLCRPRKGHKKDRPMLCLDVLAPKAADGEGLEAVKVLAKLSTQFPRRRKNVDPDEPIPWLGDEGAVKVWCSEVGSQASAKSGAASARHQTEHLAPISQAASDARVKTEPPSQQALPHACAPPPPPPPPLHQNPKDCPHWGWKDTRERLPNALWDRPHHQVLATDADPWNLIEIRRRPSSTSPPAALPQPASLPSPDASSQARSPIAGPSNIQAAQPWQAVRRNGYDTPRDTEPGSDAASIPSNLSFPSPPADPSVALATSPTVHRERELSVTRPPPPRQDGGSPRFEFGFDGEELGRSMEDLDDDEAGAKEAEPINAQEASRASTPWDDDALEFHELSGYAKRRRLERMRTSSPAREAATRRLPEDATIMSPELSSSSSSESDSEENDFIAFQLTGSSPNPPRRSSPIHAIAPSASAPAPAPVPANVSASIRTSKVSAQRGRKILPKRRIVGLPTIKPVGEADTGGNFMSSAPPSEVDEDEVMQSTPQNRTASGTDDGEVGVAGFQTAIEMNEEHLAQEESMPLQHKPTHPSSTPSSRSNMVAERSLGDEDSVDTMGRDAESGTKRERKDVEEESVVREIDSTKLFRSPTPSQSQRSQKSVPDAPSSAAGFVKEEEFEKLMEEGVRDEKAESIVARAAEDPIVADPRQVQDNQQIEGSMRNSPTQYDAPVGASATITTVRGPLVANTPQRKVCTDLPRLAELPTSSSPILPRTSTSDHYRRLSKAATSSSGWPGLALGAGEVAPAVVSLAKSDKGVMSPPRQTAVPEKVNGKREGKQVVEAERSWEEGCGTSNRDPVKAQRSVSGSSKRSIDDVIREENNAPMPAKELDEPSAMSSMSAAESEPPTKKSRKIKPIFVWSGQKAKAPTWSEKDLRKFKWFKPRPAEAEAGAAGAAGPLSSKE